MIFSAKLNRHKQNAKIAKRSNRPKRYNVFVMQSKPNAKPSRTGKRKKLA